MPNKPLVSVVIPAYNGTDFLCQNLPAVMALKADEVIIVNDSSTDDTGNFISTNFPDIKLITHSRNYGFSRTVNDGFAASTGQIVVLLNQDAKPHPNLFTSVFPHFKNPDILAVTLNAQNQSWAKASLKNGFIEYTNGENDSKPHFSFWASGGAAAFRKSTWQELGGLDTALSPGYSEDFDLGWRAWRRGFKIIWEPKALVDHVQPESTFNRKYTPRRLSHIKDRNFLLAHWKNLDSSLIGTHVTSILKRVLAHPGYIVPVILALTKLTWILKFRDQEKSYVKFTCSEIINAQN